LNEFRRIIRQSGRDSNVSADPLPVGFVIRGAQHVGQPAAVFTGKRLLPTVQKHVAAFDLAFQANAENLSQSIHAYYAGDMRFIVVSL